MRTATISGTTLFRSEITEADRLGYRMQVRPGNLAVAVRLIPVTPKAKATARANQGAALEAVTHYGDSSEADAIRECMRSVLDKARQS